ncbi:MAG: ferredoxin family protein [Verrucomicrobiia bacterium]
MKMLTVIIFRSPSQDPRKHELEEGILAALAREPDVVSAAMPHLYDFGEADAAMASLRSVTGPLLVLAWLYPRAIHWTLDRLGIKGQCGETQLHRADVAADSQKETLKSGASAPARTIWSLDLRDGDNVVMHVEEIQRILREIHAAPLPAQDGSLSPSPLPIPHPTSNAQNPPLHHWYPVIDYGRCNQCMECLDFCLFGVYDVNDDGHVVVESPGNCKKGCPACSRVCPENAIIFPMHRTPSIAGAPGARLDVQKLDLSELFGAPAAVKLAADERNAALVGDGRKAVADPQHRDDKETKPKDNLDKLMDALDDAKL